MWYIRFSLPQHCLPTLFQCSNKSLHLIMTQFKSIPENRKSNKNDNLSLLYPTHPLHAAGPSNVLTAQLACFRSAKAHLKEGLSQLDHLYSPEDIFKKAMGHADEQVAKVKCLIFIKLIISDRFVSQRWVFCVRVGVPLSPLSHTSCHTSSHSWSSMPTARPQGSGTLCSPLLKRCVCGQTD